MKPHKSTPSLSRTLSISSKSHVTKLYNTGAISPSSCPWGTKPNEVYILSRHAEQQSSKPSLGSRASLSAVSLLIPSSATENEGLSPDRPRDKTQLKDVFGRFVNGKLSSSVSLHACNERSKNWALKVCFQVIHRRRLRLAAGAINPWIYLLLTTHATLLTLDSIQAPANSQVFLKNGTL